MTDSGVQDDATPQPPVTPRVLVFFDYACPFCYLDWPRFKRLRAQHDAELFMIPFELRPLLAPEGVSMEEMGGGHSEHVEEHMRRMASDADLPLAFPSRMPNTHAALALGEYARDLGPEMHETVHEALFEAYNGRARDIGDVDVLLDVAASCGLDPEDVRTALGEGRYDERLHQFQHLAISFGITATPAAIVCNQILIGTRPYRVLEEALRECLVDEHSVGAAAGGEATTT